MTITRALLVVVLLIAAAGCDRMKPPEPTAKNDMAGKIVFSTASFDDAKKYKTFEEFKAANKVIEEFVVTAPESSLKWYAVFKEQLGGEEFIVQVYDRTDNVSVKSERRDGTPTTGQTTAGWTFAMPEWPIPPPKSADEVIVNDIWIKPGHSYEVVILKPLAKGSFRVADAPVATKPEPAPKGKKKGG